MRSVILVQLIYPTIFLTYKICANMILQKVFKMKVMI
jgi:hypothetical protein